MDLIVTWSLHGHNRNSKKKAIVNRIYNKSLSFHSFYFNVVNWIKKEVIFSSFSQKVVAYFFTLCPTNFVTFDGRSYQSPVIHLSSNSDSVYFWVTTVWKIFAFVVVSAVLLCFLQRKLNKAYSYLASWH